MKVFEIAKAIAINATWSAENVLNTCAYAHKGSYSCLGGVTYALGANDRGVTGAGESLVPGSHSCL